MQDSVQSTLQPRGRGNSNTRSRGAGRGFGPTTTSFSGRGSATQTSTRGSFPSVQLNRGSQSNSRGRGTPSLRANRSGRNDKGGRGTRGNGTTNALRRFGNGLTNGEAVKASEIPSIGPHPVITVSATSPEFKNHVHEVWLKYKDYRVQERAHAISTKQISDPNKRTKLSEAIAFVGSCETMCPYFEMVDRIHGLNVDKCERVSFTHISQNSL